MADEERPVVKLEVNRGALTQEVIDAIHDRLVKRLASQAAAENSTDFSRSAFSKNGFSRAGFSRAMAAK
jgi:hypothetical protein